MTISYQIVLYSHILAGAIALILFWVPVTAKKGALNHRKFGVHYRHAMQCTIFSGAVLAAVWLFAPVAVNPNLADNPAAAANLQRFAIFLLHLAVQMYASVMMGQWALDAKQNRQSLRSVSRIAPAVLLAATSLFIGVIGIMNQHILMLVFAPLGLTLSISQLRFIFAKQVAPKAWLVEHLGGYIGSGIAAYTAFAAFGGRTLFSDIGAWQYAFWVLPGLIGGIAISRLSRKYSVSTIENTGQNQAKV
jgi:accessory gene regulator protein AgrB